MNTGGNNLIGQRTGFFGLAACLYLCLLVLCAGCSRSPEPVDPQGAVDLFDQLRHVHREHRYKDLEAMVDPRQLTTLVRTLMAVDRLLDVSGQLRATAEAKVGPTAAEVCNMTVLADYLGPFSTHAHVVSSRQDGGDVWVIYQVGERVPVERALMRFTGGRWVYVPDDADDKLPDLLRELTDQLVSLKVEAQRGTYHERAFIDEYARRVQEPLAAHLAKVEQENKKKPRQTN